MERDELHTVKEIMSSPVISITATEKIEDFIKKIYETGLRRFPVLIGGFPEGIVTAYDVVKLIYQNPDSEILNLTVGEIMTKEPVTVDVSASVFEGLDLMVKKNVGCIPVINAENNELVGIISERDYLWHDFLWENVPSEFVDVDEGIGDKVTPDFFITEEFSIWQITDRMIKVNRRQLLVGDPETFHARSIVSSVDLLVGIAKNLRVIRNNPDYFMNAWKAFPLHSVAGLPAPQTITALRRWMGKRGFGAFPLFYRGKAVKMIDEKNLVKYLWEKIK